MGCRHSPAHCRCVPARDRNELKATSLNHGAYTGSLQAELDKSTEIRPIVRTTKLTGDGYFVLDFEPGKPAKASFLSGEKGFAGLLPVVQAHAFPPELPTGSKARLLREVHLICSPWAGCDAYLILPGSVQLPGQIIKFAPVNESKSTGSKTTRTVRIEKPQ